MPLLFLFLFLACSPALIAQKMPKQALLIPYRIGSQWGYANEKGDLKIPVRFDDAAFFQQDLAKIKMNEAWGLIDRKGNVFLPCLYNIVYGAGKEARIVVCKGGDKNGHLGKWGFVNQYFPEKTEFALDYDLIRECGGKGLLGVMQQGRWGAINGAGKVLIPIKYTVEPVQDHAFSTENQGAVFLPNEDTENKQAYLKLRFSQGLARVSLDKKWGFLNESGNAVVPIEHPFVGEFEEGVAAIVQQTANGLRLGFVNQYNETIIPFEYEVREDKYRQTKFNEGIALLCKDGKLGYINTQNTPVVPFQYALAYPFSEARAWVSIAYALQPAWEMIDKKGQTIFKLPADYQLLDFTFQQGVVRVRQAGKENFLNKKGELLLKEWATQLFPFQQESAVSVVTKAGKVFVGYLDMKGDWTIPPLYDYTPNLAYTQRTGDFIKLRLAGKCGILNAQGKIVIPFEYENINLPYYIPKNELYGLYNRLPAMQDGKWGYLNSKNEWAIAPEYEQALFFEEAHAKVKHAGKWGYINTLNKKFWR